MSITTKQLLDFATAQLSLEDETLIRAGVSRAYYCAYHSLADVAKLVPSVNSSTDPYLPAREIIHRLEAWNISKWPTLKTQQTVAARAANKFRILRDLRVNADYYLETDASEDALSAAIARARELKVVAFQLGTAVQSAQQQN